MIYRLRLLAGLLLLAAAANSVWQLIDTLSTRRARREELAEISHVRYGILNADRWVEKIVPILNAQVDALDLTAENRATLKPTVITALNRLLDQVKDQLAPKPAPNAGFAAQAQAMIINNMLAGLKPHVPEYADAVLKELGKPENKKAVKDYLRGAITDGAKATFGAVDMGRYNSILRQYGCADGVACQAELGKRIAVLDAQATQNYLIVLGAALLAFLLLTVGGAAAIAVQLLFCIALLIGGIFTPMIEVEAKISKVTLTFYNQPISFPEQLLYYQSKSVLEVFRTLIDMGQPEMSVVAVLVLMFSVVFPALKILTVAICLYNPAVLKYRLAKFFALESSKWSMADVMALAIFMAFVAFNGLIGNAMGLLRGAGAQLVIPTDSSKVLPGFYLFIGFVLASLWLAKNLERYLRTVEPAGAV